MRSNVVDLDSRRPERALARVRAALLIACDSDLAYLEELAILGRHYGKPGVLELEQAMADLMRARARLLEGQVANG